ncbi:hypothetical protein B296_00020293 [Ensete ventricosum]|uniref:Uncharacterized protein n=1 Tax=Ensete ventricosum TaxID=4639 RepID=A0A426ZZD7_ENSVE|nr:hypothetical protein B296_00020293 [Ensete ventricosum]
MRRGTWTAEEDQKLVNFIINNGVHCWRLVPKLAGTYRTFSDARTVLEAKMDKLPSSRPQARGHLPGRRDPNHPTPFPWSKIASYFPGRTDNEIKNHWNTRIKKRLNLPGLNPPATHELIDPPNANNPETIGMKPKQEDKISGFDRPIWMPFEITNAGEIRLQVNSSGSCSSSSAQHSLCASSSFPSSEATISLDDLFFYGNLLARKEKHVAALGGSISFGRFLSESLDWGKWSSFHHNRYLEEVERYSVPGSVARKKAYFEAHYKRVAAKKEAANAANKSLPERQTDVAGFVESEKKSNRTVDQGACLSRAGIGFDLCEVAEAEKGNAIEEDKIHIGSSLQLEATDVAVEEGEQAESEEKSNHKVDNSRKGTSFDLCDKSNEPQVAEAEKGNAIEGDEIHIGSSLQLEPTDVAVEDIENKNKSSGFELSEICTSEKKPLKVMCLASSSVSVSYLCQCH